MCQLLFCYTKETGCIIAQYIRNILFPTAWPAILLPTLYCVLNIAPTNIAFGPWTGTTVWAFAPSSLISFVLNTFVKIKKNINVIKSMLIPYLMFIPGIKVADSNVITKVNWSVIFLTNNTKNTAILKRFKVTKSFIDIKPKP